MSSPCTNSTAAVATAIAALEQLVEALTQDELHERRWPSPMNDAERALGFARSVAKSCRFAELEAEIGVGDLVNLTKWGARGRVMWFNARERVIGIERDGYGPIGGVDATDVAPVAIDELGRWVAILERQVAEWADKPGRDKLAPERLAGYQRQLARLAAA